MEKKKNNLHFTGCCPESTSVLFRKGTLFICKLMAVEFSFLIHLMLEAVLGR